MLDTHLGSKCGYCRLEAMEAQVRLRSPQEAENNHVHTSSPLMGGIYEYITHTPPTPPHLQKSHTRLCPPSVLPAGCFTFWGGREGGSSSPSLCVGFLLIFFFIN